MAQAETQTPQIPVVEEAVSEVGQLSQWTLIRRRFARNKLAMTGFIGLIIMYILVFLGAFVAPNEYTYQNNDYTYGGPSNFTLTGPQGQFGLYMYPMITILDAKAFKFVFEIDRTQRLPVKFFVKGDPYTMFGFIKSDIHLFGAVLGTVSGYFMGVADDIIQRIIEVISSFPTIPLWAALAAALPPVSENFTALDRYFLITVVLSFVGWTGLARQLRAKVMAYRGADFCQAAVSAGSSDARIIFIHMLPNAASHIIISAALSIPGMILGETSLSFLGLGILPPMVSWGALLRDAQQVTVIVQHPWIMIPGVAVILTVLLFSFLGDGIRDAVDPYSI